MDRARLVIRWRFQFKSRFIIVMIFWLTHTLQASSLVAGCWGATVWLVRHGWRPEAARCRGGRTGEVEPGPRRHFCIRGRTAGGSPSWEGALAAMFSTRALVPWMHAVQQRSTCLSRHVMWTLYAQGMRLHASLPSVLQQPAHRARQSVSTTSCTSEEFS